MCRRSTSIPAHWPPPLPAEQAPGCSVFAIGEAGLLNALYDAGITMNDVNPDYVVVGEGRSYSLDTLTKATNLVMQGAKLIGANSDVSGLKTASRPPAVPSSHLLRWQRASRPTLRQAQSADDADRAEKAELPSGEAVMVWATAWIPT